MRGAGCGVRDAGCGADMVSLRETNLFIWPSALIYPRARDTITGHGTRIRIQTNDSIPITIRTRSTGPLPNYDAGHLHEPRNTNHESRKPLKFSNWKNKPAQNHFVSAQLVPSLTSATNGTLRVTMDSMVSLRSLDISSFSSLMTSATNSSWTCKRTRLL